MPLNLKPIARKVGPETSRRSASKIQSVKYEDVHRMLKRLGRATCEQVILALKESIPEGKMLREDPISGMFNLMCQRGMIVPTGKFTKNTSGHEAIVWRIAKPEEKEYLKKFVGDHKTPWPSPDTLLELKEVRMALKDHKSEKVQRMYHRYRKAIIFKSDFKDRGIKWLMANYETNGRRRR